MPYKRRATGTATRTPTSNGRQSVAVPAHGDPIHMLREHRSKPGEPVRVFATCGAEGGPYVPGRGGLRMTGWRTDVTCDPCRAAPGVATVDVVVGEDETDG